MTKSAAAAALDLRRLQLDKRDEILPQVDRVEDEQKAGHGTGECAAALCDGIGRHRTLVRCSDVGLVCEGVYVGNGAEDHLHANAHVLDTIGDVVCSEVLRLKAVKGAGFLQGNHNDLLPKREKNDALDGPKLGDRAEGLQLLRRDDVHQHEGVHGDGHAGQIDEIDPDIAEPGVDRSRTQDVVELRDNGGECGDRTDDDVLQAASLAPCVTAQQSF